MFSLLITRDPQTALAIFPPTLFGRHNWFCEADTKGPNIRPLKHSSHPHISVATGSFLNTPLRGGRREGGRTEQSREKYKQMEESETVMDGRRVEGCESPDGTVKRIHNGNTTLAVFSVPVPPWCSDGSDGECSLTWV